MSMQIRPFRAPDLGPVVSLWNRCLTRDPITAERFWHLFLLDPNFDPAGALVAEGEDGSVVGFLQAMARRVPYGRLGTQPSAGWITVFFVAPEHRRKGIGRRLMEAGLAHLKGLGRTDVTCNGYAPYYVFPGIDVEYADALAFMAAMGFAAVSEPVAMGMRLEGVRTPEPVRVKRRALEAQGYEVRLFGREDTLALLDLADEEFPHWAPGVLEGLHRGDEQIVVAAHEGRIVAFAQWQNVHTDPPAGAPGRFGPFGVRADLRSKGIGAVVFYDLIERVAGDGARYLWFGWAGGRNLSFYERAGCVVARRFKLFKRTV